MTAPPSPLPDAPLPDDAELLRLDHQICFSLHAAARAFGGVYRDALKDLGLTYPQYLAMLVLWEEPDPQPVKAIGERLRLDSGTLSPLLKRLEAAGLVVRERSAEDERSVVVRVTDAGEELRERALPVPRRIVAASGLSLQDAFTLRGLLERLTENLDASQAGQAGER
ncbi:MarR family winged helix-turn-helix transcriptional regulator [Streptomyces roseoverticillatus]|uniref:MarR family winged helix-turn-helix transcriptional regulator n=1 Tax=Streptomyces roseoverticillatus TaxID=66429 RepID=UPI0004C231D3|nr:MarR family transcriptional regulator [Streptomyces roseoverticillatus]